MNQSLLKTLQKLRGVQQKGKKGKEKGEQRQEIKEIEYTGWFLLEAAFQGDTSSPFPDVLP